MQDFLHENIKTKNLEQNTTRQCKALSSTYRQQWILNYKPVTYAKYPFFPFLPGF